MEPAFCNWDRIFPGNREYASSWVDHNGNFWLFGGYGSGSSSGSGYFNDLWEFNPNSTPITWSWKIASTIGHPVGAYNGPGNLGIPMVRSNAASWTDNSGKLWLFGGTYEDSQGTHYLNDMWMFDPISTTNGNQWTLVSSNVSRLSDAVDQEERVTLRKRLLVSPEAAIAPRPGPTATAISGSMAELATMRALFPATRAASATFGSSLPPWPRTDGSISAETPWPECLERTEMWGGPAPPTTLEAVLAP